MMRILHLSDFHFGTEVLDLKERLLVCLKDTPADLVVVSGDFTQIGSPEEFTHARNFLDALGKPVFCVPGNHDIPRYRLDQRFFDPFRRYRTYISPELAPVLRTGEACIAGINTARNILPHWNWANGAISAAQLKKLENIFGPEAGFKICVMHHPVHKAEGNPLRTIVFGGERALNAIRRMKIDLVLTGHVHHASITTMENDGHKTVFLSASTAVSRRLRRESNGYNLITFENNTLGIEIFSFREGAFQPQEKFERKQ